MTKTIAGKLRRTGEMLKGGKYVREEGKGTSGQPSYKPTLWYWITPGGKKKLVDQKTGG